jgi:hypothetical protein
MASKKDISQTVDFWRKIAEDFYSVSTKDWADMTDIEQFTSMFARLRYENAIANESTNS